MADHNDASKHVFSPSDLDDWTTNPSTVNDALDELGSRAQGAVFDAYDDTGGLSVTGSNTVVNLVQRTNTDTGTFGLSGDILTVTQAGGGTIDISYHATIGNTGSDDYGFSVYLARSTDGGSSFSNIAGSLLQGGKGT